MLISIDAEASAISASIPESIASTSAAYGRFFEKLYSNSAGISRIDFCCSSSESSSSGGIELSVFSLRLSTFSEVSNKACNIRTDFNGLRYNTSCALC